MHSLGMPHLGVLSLKTHLSLASERKIPQYYFSLIALTMKELVSIYEDLTIEKELSAIQVLTHDDKGLL